MEKRVDLDITISPQQETQWCYAAVAQAVMKFYNVEKTQEEIAAWANRDDEKRTKVKVESENCPQDPVHILEKYGMYAATERKTAGNSGPMLDNILKSIEAGNPVVAQLDEGKGVFHYILIKGFHKEAGGRRAPMFFHILDPEGGEEHQKKALDYVLSPAFQGVLYLKKPSTGGKRRKKTQRRKKHRHTLRMNSHWR